MKVVILAGGYGTRLSEETKEVPKPMVRIGSMPIIWHIIKHYSHYGFNDFIIAANEKNNSLVMKKFFYDLMNLEEDITLDFSKKSTSFIKNKNNKWNIKIIDTGADTETAGRIFKLKSFIGNERFLVTYGDGVSDLNLNELIKTHESKKGIATLTAVRPTARFGYLSTEDNKVLDFEEKHPNREAFINAGYFVFEPEVFDYFNGDHLSLAVLKNIALDGKLFCHYHHGFWQCMDTMRDVRILRDKWESNNTEWKLWD